MENGNFWIQWRADKCWNFWSIEEPNYSWKGFSKIKQKIQVLESSTGNKEKWLRKGFRCEKCELITFSYSKEHIK